MVLLGLAVGTGPVAVDVWFQRLGADLGPYRRVLLVFSQPLIVAAALGVGVLVALRQRRTGLAWAMVISPVVAVGVVRLVLKPLFGREKGGALAYPSGHTTFLVVVLGLLVLVVGVRLWTVAAATCIGLLGMFGVSTTFHYFTDTVGAALWAVSVVGVVALSHAGHPGPTGRT